jgi:opacity protein-like surface antigen
MKKFALAMTASMLALAAPAVAGDGFYMGLGLSYNSNENVARHSLAPSGTWFTANNRAAINAAPTTDVSTDVFAANLMFGYRTHVASNVFAGIEADATVFDGEADDFHTQNYPDAPGAFTLNQHISQQWISTLRLRLGIDITPDVAAFVTAGGSVSDVELRTTYSDTYPLNQRILAQSGVSSELQTGWVYGGGFDWAMGGSTSLRVEYLRHDLGHLKNARTLTWNTGADTPGPEVLRSDADLNTNSIRVGLVWDLNL